MTHSPTAPEVYEISDISSSHMADPYIQISISNSLDILEIISDCRSDPFTLLELDLLANSYRIACINIQNFEKGENCASTVSMDHTVRSDMNFIRSDMILFGSDLILLRSRF